MSVSHSLDAKKIAELEANSYANKATQRAEETLWQPNVFAYSHAAHTFLLFTRRGIKKGVRAGFGECMFRLAEMLIGISNMILQQYFPSKFRQSEHHLAI